MNIISKKQLDTANLAVTRELYALGFWDEALAATDTYLIVAGNAYGYQMYESSGEILIPSISVSRLGEKLFKLARATLRDILRHEFAHAYAHTHPEKKKLTEEFKNDRPVLALTFKGSYFHWILLTGIHEDGVYTADSLQPGTRSRMDWDEIHTDLLGAIAAIPGDDLLTSALLRSGKFDVAVVSKFVQHIVAKR